MAGTAFVKPSRKLLLFVFVLLAIVAVTEYGEIWFQRWHANLVKTRLNPVSKDDIESRVALKKPPALVMEGTVDGHNFELIMRGYTNYFMKETWGAERGQRSFFGGQKPGGYRVVIRTKNFTGEWHLGWSGTHGGGGGAGFDEYEDDLLPGRWLWNGSGFVGAKSDYEHHQRTLTFSNIWAVQQWDEEYAKCKAFDGALVPTRITWQMTGQSGGQEWRKDVETDVTYKIRSFKFQDAPSEAWFSDQVKKYFPDSAHFKITNAPPALVSTNR